MVNETSVVLNPDRWTKKQSMLFVEIPYGVGFSFTSSEEEANTARNDTTTWEDNYFVMQAFYRKYPQVGGILSITSLSHVILL